MTRALIVVDVQNDFITGSLAVKRASSVVFDIADYIEHWGHTYDVIVGTLDSHQGDNDNGGHFALFPDYVDSWPVHCVEGTEGHDIHRVIKDHSMMFDAWFRKGQGRPDYSGFQGVTQTRYGSMSLDHYLKDRSIAEVDVIGIAGDYCVLQTALDAKRNGYVTRILPQYVASVGGKEATTAAIRALDSLT